MAGLSMTRGRSPIDIIRGCRANMAVLGYFGHRTWHRRPAGTSPAIRGAVTL
ncbi:hypothetical protein [Nonomuraea sp. NPDC050643]|uniref:hypothetical protein n=1 Tax=Nonomuraea sp. NPDC050643 TaxID=3155660 RepID=UPI0033CBC0B3